MTTMGEQYPHTPGLGDKESALASIKNKKLAHVTLADLQWPF